MTQKWDVRSGILVAILAQCAGLTACVADGEEDPAEESDGGTGGAEPAGDGDGGTGGAEPAGAGDGDDCEDLLLILPLTVDVGGAWQDAEQQCRATVAVTFEGETHELDCSGVGSDCECQSVGIGLPSDGVTLTVSDGETVLYERSDLQDIANPGGCGSSPRFGHFEVDYIEALGDAVSSLKNAAPDLASPEPCDTEADCEAVPLGSKACGGPWSYAVVSTESETYSDVVALAEELERIEEIYNVVADVTSDCAYEVEPELACEEGVCVATSPE